MLQGLRFDLIVVSALVLVPVLLVPLLGNKTIWPKALLLFLVSAFSLVVFMEVVTPTFIAEYDLRPNILFVEYLRYPREVFSMLLGGYKLDIVLALIALVAVTVLFTRFLSTSVAPLPRFKIKTALFCSSLLVVLCILGMRSSLGHRPANPATVAFSTDLLVNDLILSSLYSTLYAVYSSAKHEASSDSYGRMPPDKVVQEIRSSMVIDQKDFLSMDLPTLHRPNGVKSTDRPMNLVIILEESLGAEFVGALGGVNVTPELDALSREGIWFENLYATGTRSARGIEAVITGFTPTPARSVVKLPNSQTGFFTLAELLDRQGYATSFMYGGEAHFDNMRSFFVGNGFKTIIEEKDFVDPVFSGSWGVSDEDLFQRAHTQFNKSSDKPFFSLLFTSSNHSPFEYPDERISLFEEPKATVNNAVKYADHALGDYIRKAKASNYWENTLFLVVADHNSRVRGADLVPINYFHIPALILGGTVAPKKISRLASQIDLLPTLLGMLGIDDAIPATGYDLFRPDIDSIPGRAIMQYNNTQAYMEEDQVVVLEMDKPPTLYQRTNNGLVLSREQNSSLIDCALAHSIWSTTAYNNKLYQIPPRVPTS